MTTIAISRIRPSPCNDDSNACAVPWNIVEIVAGTVAAATCRIWVTASPSARPGLRLNEIVTDGSWPVWLTNNGPASVLVVDTVLSGINEPFDDRTYSIDSAAGSRWNSGATCRMTWYWLFGA